MENLLDKGNMNFNDSLSNLLLSKGASKMGYADVSVLGEEQNSGYPTAIAIAVALDPVVIERISSGPHTDYCWEYDYVNEQLDALGHLAENWLKAHGYDAYAITRNKAPYDSKTCITQLPYKTVARLAGIGWIGKNALLVTKEYGCAQRLSVVLTNAPFETNEELIEPRCGKCTNCKEICPGQAISGTLWSLERHRDELVDFNACQDTVRERGVDMPIRSVRCGLCIAGCPYTKAYIARSRKARQQNEI